MFNETESAEVAACVRDVEARTSSEVAVVWAARADDYVLVRGLWALALAAVGVAELGARGFAVPAVWLPGVTVVAVVGLYLLFGFGPFLRWLVPESLLSERVHRSAQVAFLEFGVSETEARSGVLLFLCAIEHRVEIVADRGIAARVGAEVWQSVVADLVLALKQGQHLAGVKQALERIGDLLAHEFPRQAGDQNELGDAPREFRA